MIPFFSLDRQYRTLSRELTGTFNKTCKAGAFILGNNVAAFEKEFARYVGVNHAVGVASGTDALTLAVRALGFGTGDEVLVPANSYPTVFGVAQSGVRIRLADCTENGTVSAEDVIRRITPKTRAVVAVHLYGNHADVAQLKKMIPKRIRIIEDAAQYHKKNSGLVGDIGIYSFYPTKNLGALGDGGMVITRASGLASRVRGLRMYGEKVRYKSTEVSGVSRLDELQAAFLRLKLRHLDTWNNRRRDLAARYIQKLRGARGIFVVPQTGDSCHHLFVIRTTRRAALQAHLASRGIGSAIHYPHPIHLTPAFRRLGYHSGDFPMAETLAREVLSLPLFPEMMYKEIDHVARVIVQWSS